MQLVLVIPAYQPGRELEDLLRALVQSPFESVIVVDDGSGADYQTLFRRIESLGLVTVLRHESNRGKGAALKTGIQHIQTHFAGCAGVVTADADGQHQAGDIVAVAQCFRSNPRCIVLGSRRFQREVPWRSRFGNRIMRGLVRWRIGQDLLDTQTGLRAIPSYFFPNLLNIKSNGYEFELDVLIASQHHKIALVEQPIKTIYHPGNPSSHFNPFMDSLKILFVLFRFRI